MAKDYPRSNQIGQQIKKEIAEILQYEIQHPTLVNVTITDLELSKDLRHAKIYFISKQDQIELEKALKRSMSFIRQSLSKRMTTRGIPNLEFIYDHSIDHNDRINELLNSAFKK
ncbi:ribosome-binding factor A [Methylophilales bacterium MBRSG12]|uniref:Ribosome-binding factor A n=1 Tax=Methylophilales bacterium MBRS-H7 TaxID=1623450 RepID=A0A0H4J1W9_9PROT|nr:ribosome-binding factor A [Methylophilales bacterium MBRSF5]AKO65743.1 ribosome-binding factor A [Methylophilales bacterium MBRS-H7]AKO67065.1 ribosome-binding factor A [Methylophilales bacterium MBRSG12]